MKARTRRGFLRVLLRHNPATGATAAFRAKFVPLISPIPNWSFHDYWIALLIAGIAEIKFIDEPLILYRQHAGNQLGGMPSSPAQRMHAAVQRLLGQRSETHAAIAAKRRADLEWFTLARDRLRPVAGENAWPEIEREFSGKLTQLENRARMHEAPQSRFFLGAKELLTFRYHRYARGLETLLTDIL
jgi:hypothetical protein